MKREVLLAIDTLHREIDRKEREKGEGKTETDARDLLAHLLHYFMEDER